MASTQLILTPQRTATPIEGGVLDLLIRLQAPDAPEALVVPSTQVGALPPPAAARPALRLALVIDRSGSMHGEPLAEAIRCVQQVIARLQTGDEVAVVLYDHEVQVPIPLQPVAQVAAQTALLSAVRCGGSTALHAGWTEGLRQLGEARPNAVNRVVLLSDGRANIGPSDLAEFEPEARAALARGLSTTTVGLGSGFNEDLMLGLARAGGGQSYYGQTAADLADAFDEAFALLQALCVRQVQVHLSPAAGVQVEVLSDLGVMPDGAGGAGCVLSLPDLAFGAEAWAVVRLHLAAALPAEVDRRHLLSVRATGAVVASAAGAVVLDGVPQRLDLSGLPREMVERLPEDPLLVERRAEVLFGRAMSDVHAALRTGTPAQAQQALQRAETLAADQPWLRAKVEGMQALIARDAGMAMKEARFSSSRVSTRLAAKASLAYAADETLAPAVPRFLRRKVMEGSGGGQG